ncbi:hypothetical protein BDV97DRAFT_397978 [Delphinella strobiligena]|nr:hypothetical protein BDV97DRAFT_397978 [Delphinella strobiligena]
MSSPSEFLTFYRRVATHSGLRIRLANPSTYRSFALSSRLSKDASVKADQYPDSKHTTNKTDRLDVQSDNSAKGKEAKTRNEGGSATSQSDSRSSTKKAKEEHPEAPDVVIGMQDERGGKGH